MPFVGTVTVISIVTFIIKALKTKQIKGWHMIYTIAVFLLPVLLLKCKNHKYYGIFTVNELRDSNFVEAMECLYAIETEENIYHVDITREKLRRVYEVSPALNSIKKEIEASMDRWDYSDYTLGDHEVENGWVMWAFREAVLCFCIDCRSVLYTYF